MADPTTAQIQGRDATLRVFLNGQVVNGLPIKKFDWEADDEIRSRDVLGERRSQRQHLIHGYKGTFDMDVSNSRHHEIIKFLNDSDKSGLPNYTFGIQVAEYYRDASSKRYRFTGVVLRIPKTSAGGRKDDLTVSITFEAEDLAYL